MTLWSPSPRSVPRLSCRRERPHNKNQKRETTVVQVVSFLLLVWISSHPFVLCLGTILHSFLEKISTYIVLLDPARRYSSTEIPRILLSLGEPKNESIVEKRFPPVWCRNKASPAKHTKLVHLALLLNDPSVFHPPWVLPTKRKGKKQSCVCAETVIFSHPMSVRDETNCAMSVKWDLCWVIFPGNRHFKTYFTLISCSILIFY